MQIIYTTFSKKNELETVRIENLKSPSSEKPETLLENIIDFTDIEEKPTPVGFFHYFSDSGKRKKSTEEKRQTPIINIQYTDNYQKLINDLKTRENNLKNIRIEFERIEKSKKRK